MSSPSFYRMTAVLCLVAFASLTGCQSAYYKTWEKLGWEKRDILVDRVEDGRDAQQDAKKQFQTTMERFQELTNFKGGSLEAQYKKLKAEHERSEDRAAAVSKRIDGIESVANDMFKEWKAEMSQYKTAELRRSSEEMLDQTRDRYEELIGAMKRAESKMKPVLEAFGERVIFLKHNLNAQAIASLQNQVDEIQTDVSGLVSDMEAAINEANEFIKQMPSSS